MVKRYVITGPPGSGKTTIINQLKKRGFYCVGESSREIIKHQLEIGGDAVPWKDVLSFSEIVLNSRIKQFIEVKDNVSFFDRGIPDINAYFLVDNIKIPNDFQDAAIKYKYEPIVFVTQPWGKIFEKDSERKESFEKSLIIYNKIKEYYSELGYKIVLLPKDKVDNIVDYIISKVDNIDK